jgi:hypothetical protein
MFVFFINGIFLNISFGSQVNISQFKEIEEVNVLPISFFNYLLEYRNICDQEAANGQTYA